MAAEQRSAQAEYNLGLVYWKGTGASQDYAKAIEWFRKAAEQGQASAQNSIGIMYLLGNGVVQNYSEAVKWYYKAAAQGFAEAQYNLGIAYAEGQAGSKDYIQAHKWFNLAAAQGYELARVNRDRIANNMSPYQITEAQRLAREWPTDPEPVILPTGTEPFEFPEAQATVLSDNPNLTASVLLYRVAMICDSVETVTIVRDKQMFFMALLDKMHQNRSRSEWNDPQVQEQILKQAKQEANNLLSQLAGEGKHQVIEMMYIKLGLLAN